jgi:hypothetical protein
VISGPELTTAFFDRALAFAAAREKLRFVQETNEVSFFLEFSLSLSLSLLLSLLTLDGACWVQNGIIRMGALLREQLGALEALGQQLREWYLEHFPELKDLLPADFGRSEATSWPNLVLLLGPCHDPVTTLDVPK